MGDEESGFPLSLKEFDHQCSRSAAADTRSRAELDGISRPLPTGADEDAIDATYSDGILTVSTPITASGSPAKQVRGQEDHSEVEDEGEAVSATPTSNPIRIRTVRGLGCSSEVEDIRA
ncbi:Hsp20/alpha crystallin family protein [Prescottella defluvii]|nr:Hsp20/alpha crystallin family protein [Prescottella defluvii]